MRNCDNRELTLEEIGLELGISHARVRQLIVSGLRKLKRACRRYGIDESDIIGKPASMTARLQEWACLQGE